MSSKLNLFKIKNKEQHCKEVYYKVKEQSDLPVAQFHYTIIENYEYLQEIDQYIIFEINPFNSVNIDFNKDDNVNINKLIESAKKHGSCFLFFNNSFEGENYFNNHRFELNFPI